MAHVGQLRPWIDPDDWGRRTRAQQRRERRGEMRFALGHGRWCSPDVLVHRMLPADADITLVWVNRSHVSVTARVPAPSAPSQPGPAVALHLGWRSMSDGSLRVGTHLATRALSAPPPGLELIVSVPAAKARGVRSEVVAASGTSIHEPCDTDAGRGEEFVEGVDVWCPTCETAYDQDLNAACRMLKSADR